MPAAATLTDAARLVPTNLTPKWANNTLRAALIAFAGDLYDDFPAQEDGNAPILNWLAVIGAFAPEVINFSQSTVGTLVTGIDTIETYERASDYVYRLCKFADAYVDAGHITSAQADAILAAYNARFA